jgi:hypothetical protein
MIKIQFKSAINSVQIIHILMEFLNVYFVIKDVAGAIILILVLNVIYNILVKFNSEMPLIYVHV